MYLSHDWFWHITTPLLLVAKVKVKIVICVKQWLHAFCLKSLQKYTLSLKWQTFFTKKCTFRRKKLSFIFFLQIFCPQSTDMKSLNCVYKIMRVCLWSEVPKCSEPRKPYKRLSGSLQNRYVLFRLPHHNLAIVSDIHAFHGWLASKAASVKGVPCVRCRSVCGDGSGDTA